MNKILSFYVIYLSHFKSKKISPFINMLSMTMLDVLVCTSKA